MQSRKLITQGTEHLPNKLQQAQKPKKNPNNKKNQTKREKSKTKSHCLLKVQYQKATNRRDHNYIEPTNKPKIKIQTKNQTK